MSTTPHHHHSPPPFSSPTHPPKHASASSLACIYSQRRPQMHIITQGRCMFPPKGDRSFFFPFRFRFLGKQKSPTTTQPPPTHSHPSFLSGPPTLLFWKPDSAKMISRSNSQVMRRKIIHPSAQAAAAAAFKPDHVPWNWSGQF